MRKLPPIGKFVQGITHRGRAVNTEIGQTCFGLMVKGKVDVLAAEVFTVPFQKGHELEKRTFIPDAAEKIGLGRRKIVFGMGTAIVRHFQVHLGRGHFTQHNVMTQTIPEFGIRRMFGRKLFFQMGIDLKIRRTDRVGNQGMQFVRFK